MTATPPADAPQPSARARILAAFAASFGWILHDVHRLAGGGHPPDALAILKGSIAVLLGIQLVALLPRWGRGLVGLALVTLVARGVLDGAELSPIAKWLPRAFLLLMVAVGTALVLSRTVARGAVGETALACGALGCALVTQLRDIPALWSVIGLSCVPFLFAMLARPRTTWRRGVTLGVVGLLVALPARHWPGPSIRRIAPRSASASSATDDRPNLLLIVLDTVRADHLGSYGYDRDTTPRIDRFFEKRGTRFLDARSASSWTLASHGTLFTGHLPSDHRAEIMGGQARPLRADLPTLAERLQLAGYATAGVVANLAYFSDRLGLARGFAHFDNRPAGWTDGYLPLAAVVTPDPRIGNSLYRRAEAITDAALAWLEVPGDEPFFLFVNYMDAHDPLLPPKPVGEGNEDADAPLTFAEVRSPNPLRPMGEDLVTLYDRSLSYLDHHVGRLLMVLEALGELENTIVVLTSDHGESLGDHSFRGHGRLLYEGLVHVPLFVKPAGERDAETEARRFTAMELHDWMLEAVGLEAPPRTVSTVSEWRFLREEAPARRASFERALGRPLDQDLVVWFEPNGHKVIAAPDGTLEVYDLEADPGEEHPLELGEDERRALAERAREWWAGRPIGPTTEDEASQAELEAMKDLGYL